MLHMQFGKVKSKSKDFTLVEKFCENQLNSTYVTQRYTSLANLGNIPIRWVIFSDSIFDTLITVVDSCRYWGTLRWYNGYPPPSSAFQQAYLLKVIGTTTTIGLDPKESKNNCL